MTEQRHGDDPTLGRNEFNPGPGLQEEAHIRDLRIRLHECTKDLTFREISDRTGVNSETVRRYIRDGKCSAFFLASLCKVLKINADWLLLGRGEPEYEEATRLEDIPLSELLTCLAIRQALVERDNKAGFGTPRIEPKPITRNTMVRHTRPTGS